MKKIKLYKYIGNNGTITSPILLEGIQHIALIELRAAPGCLITNGEITRRNVTLPIDEAEAWYEIEGTTE